MISSTLKWVALAVLSALPVVMLLAFSVSLFFFHSTPGQLPFRLRLSHLGKPVGFGLFDILAILGRERVAARIDRALERLAPVN